MRKWVMALTVLMSFLFLMKGYPSSSQDISTPARVGIGSPQFRAITGVSMGGYGAMNTGLSHPDTFKTVACLGGPLDMAYLLKYIEVDLLGNYDNPNLYPNRDMAFNMLKDLTISFGNPVYYNPQSTYFPPGITSDNVRTPTTLLNFFDGKSNPDGSLPVITYTDPGPNDWVEVLLAVDLNGNGKRDLGEPIPTRFHEPFVDLNGTGIYEPGDSFTDDGLDGVFGTGDYGEGNGQYSFNPNHLNYFAQDPLTHIDTLDLSTLQGLNIYLDAGTKDQFQFNVHTDNFVKALEDRGLNVQIEDGFPQSFPLVSHFENQRRVYVQYNGDHVGFKKENIGLNFNQAKRGVKGAVLVANRFTTLFAFVSDHFPGGEYGTDPFEMFFYPSKIGATSFFSPSLNRKMKIGIYLPPGYRRSATTYYPVLYLLGGYNMSISGLLNRYIQVALDGLILTKQMQKMIIVVPDGMNYKNGRGSFFVNQIDTERGGNYMDYLLDLTQHIDDHFQTK
jgi:S-formylglutathione hydrolase FrmB